MSVHSAADLLTSAKNYLDMTWEDAEGDTKLIGILSRGIVYLDHRAGVTLDYDEGTEARELLFDYCRYVRADALQDFATDFQPELLRLHLDGKVTQSETTS